MQYKYFEIHDNIMQHNDVKMQCDHNQFGILQRFQINKILKNRSHVSFNLLDSTFNFKHVKLEHNYANTSNNNVAPYNKIHL